MEHLEESAEKAQNLTREGEDNMAEAQKQVEEALRVVHRVH